MKQSIGILLLVGCAIGCTNTTSSQAPTHRWASTGAASEIQYRNDHARCQTRAAVDQGADEFDANSPAFTAYKQCMMDSGYQLTAYNGR